MQFFICCLVILFFPTLQTFGQASSRQKGNVQAIDVLKKWKGAAHHRALGELKEVETTSISNEDGVQATIEEWITDGGEYHEVVHRDFDTSEITLANHNSLSRDWNGFLRTHRGKELSRLRAAIFEHQVALFGPPESMPETTMAHLQNDTLYVLPLISADGDTTTWMIDTDTWLPAKSIRSGEENNIVTTYSDWRETNGRIIPYRGDVVEADKPDYVWERTRVAMHDHVLQEHFQPPVAGLSDTYMDTIVPPIPFNFENNHIIFPLTINGRDSVLFLFDTGADEEVINESHLGGYNLQPYGKTITSGGGGSAAYSFARGATFRLPGVELRNQHVAIIDESGLERALGMKLGGILGYDFISRFVVEIDYAGGFIILHNPATWRYLGKGYIVPVTFDNGIPFCNAVISVPTKPSIPSYMVLDFGAAETMTLTSPFVKANDILALAGTNVTVNKLAGLENQFFAQNNVRGHIDQLTVGNLVVQSFPANLSVNTKGAYASTKFSGTIGEGIYHRYHVFLDYARERIIFEPTPETDKPFPERRTYGLTILASGDDLHTYTVTAVRPDSPAEKDGFKKGDLITSLDRKLSNGFTLGYLRDCLSHEKEHHDITVMRSTDEIKLPVDVKLVSMDKR